MQLYWTRSQDLAPLPTQFWMLNVQSDCNINWLWESENQRKAKNLVNRRKESSQKDLAKTRHAFYLRIAQESFVKDGIWLGRNLFV